MQQGGQQADALLEQREPMIDNAGSNTYNTPEPPPQLLWVNASSRCPAACTSPGAPAWSVMALHTAFMSGTSLQSLLCLWQAKQPSYPAQAGAAVETNPPV